METLNLSLRQRKILYTIQQQESCITGGKLADKLKVSSRTIRSDITEINHALSPHHARILSIQSKGYLFEAEDPLEISRLNRIDNAFFTKEDRIRYLAFRLCLADTPLNLYDLEDEIFTSHTTLLYDLNALKKRYSMTDPYIRILLSKNEISFEQDERKLRSILLDQFHKGWDYNSSGNAYYGFHFLDENLMQFLSTMIPDLLQRYHIYMEDPTLVALELSLAILYYRSQAGHPLSPRTSFSKTETNVYFACSELFSRLEAYCKCAFLPAEKDEIHYFISNMHVPDCNSVNKKNASSYFGPVTLETTDKYLKKIADTFGVDFSEDDDFYQTLLLYLRELQTGKCIFTHQQNLPAIKENILGECEFAYLFQEFSMNYMGRTLTEIELTNLAILISGALSYHQALHPEKKLKTVLCCHENLTTNWALKRKLLIRFQDYIEITHLLPIHSKNTFDFSSTDLVMTTVSSKMTDFPGGKTLTISDTPDFDISSLEFSIKMRSMNKICPMPPCSVKRLFDTAWWHEKETYTEIFPIIETLASDFIGNGIATEKHLIDILSREAVFSFVVKPGIVFLHSSIPAAETRLSFMTLDHRVIWKEYKIRSIVMAVFRKEEINLLFYLKILFYSTSGDAEKLKSLKTKEEIRQFFLNNQFSPGKPGSKME
ncbi:MAG: HTH domain-containing protein [Lachnospiraceae bacterium]|nr:HTH domain-containing protein [Lachnospiraceae bacterium]